RRNSIQYGASAPPLGVPEFPDLFRKNLGKSDARSFVRLFQQQIGVARFIEPAPAAEAFAAQWGEVEQRQELAPITAERFVAADLRHAKRVAVAGASPDVDDTRRHAPALCSLRWIRCGIALGAEPPVSNFPMPSAAVRDKRVPQLLQ